MADSKSAALSSAAATEFLGASERVTPHTKLIALLATRFLPAPRDLAVA
jgi:hypothetical protein